MRMDSAEQNQLKKILQDRKMLVTLGISILLFLLYGMIFSLSAQDGEETGSLSAYLSELCVEIFDAVANKGWSESFKESLALYFEHPLRKMAHFGEYAVLGILIYILMRQWQERSPKLVKIQILWVVLSAVSDEIHQFFVPGRYSTLGDVLLDSAGGCFGMLCLVLLDKYLEKRK